MPNSAGINSSAPVLNTSSVKTVNLEPGGTNEKATNPLANLKGDELRQFIQERISCIKADGCPGSKQALQQLLQVNPEAKNLLVQMANDQNSGSAEIAREVLKSDEKVVNLKNNSSRSFVA